MKTIQILELFEPNQIFVDSHDGEQYGYYEMLLAFPEAIEKYATDGTMTRFYTLEEYEAGI